MCRGFTDRRRGTGMCLLCRRTALHLTSYNGHTEIAMALAEAGADVHCKDSAGYGSTGRILVSLVSHVRVGCTFQSGAAAGASVGVQLDAAMVQWLSRSGSMLYAQRGITGCG